MTAPVQPCLCGDRACPDWRRHLDAIETDELLARRMCEATDARRDAGRQYEAHGAAVAPTN